MKQMFFLLALGVVLALAGCGKDNNDPADDNLLRYDGENSTGPQLDAGFYETAARFPSDQTSRFAGRRLSGVRWFTGPLPVTCEVRIYGPGQNNQPGALLYSANVINQVRAFGWTEHTLSAPLTLSAEELWISIAFTHDQTTQSIGCDAGPNRPNGDWIFDSNNNIWETYRQRTGESINWNIRGVVAE